ncbi:MAG: RluA family pseudouridine synthase, partial [Proteobacteria bacterium]|nr:RluA family pseudouridine synthase [Pseudomonadota bacterium]
GEIGRLITAGAIRLGDRVGRIADPTHPGDVVTVDAAAIAAIALAVDARPLEIVDEDASRVIVDKPHGMHVHPIGPYRADTLVNALLHHAGARADQPWAAWRPHPAHRLDRAAGGLVVIAKSAAAHDALRQQLETHQLHRRYRATVHGQVGRDAGTIDAPLGRDPRFDYRRAVVASGQPAITHYVVVHRDPVADTSIVELVLATGRTHQIRAHLASLGHPIVGDTLYAPVPSASASTIALRAVALRFPDGTLITRR